MRIAITSDWHLRSNDHRRRTTNPSLLRSFLKSAHKFDHIVLAGDIFELKTDNWDTIQRDNKEIVDLIQSLMKKKKLTYIYGNHDTEMEKIWGIGESIQLPKTDILVLHGHQYDILSHPTLVPLKKVVMKSFLFMEDRGFGFASEWGFALAKKIGYVKTKKDYDKTPFYKGAQKKIKSTPHVNRLIMGHTHSATLGDGIVMNSGCNVSGKADYLLVENGKVILCDMRDGF